MKTQTTNHQDLYNQWSKLAEKRNDSKAQLFFNKLSEVEQKELKKLMIADLQKK